MVRTFLIALAVLLGAAVVAQAGALRGGEQLMADVTKGTLEPTGSTASKAAAPAASRAQPGGEHGDMVAPALAGFDRVVPTAIVSNFRTTDFLQPVPVAPSAAPDDVGAFRFLCQAGHLSYDDPVVFAGQPGKSHLHQWFGNTKANAFSTYQSLRTSGDSTCMNVLNRSAYWIPAMLDGKGNVVRPDYVSIYYKRFPASSPMCRKTAAQGCVDLPRGLRYVFGYDMVTGKSPTGAAYFNCDGPGAVPGHYPNIVAAAKGCPAGTRIGANITAPVCWNGTDLDSPNHRDHVAYPAYDGTTPYAKCPKTHPYVLPTFSLGAWYTVGRGETVMDWSLSSDDMAMPGGRSHKMTPGSTFHADWFGAWDDATLNTAMRNCVDKLLNCSDGDLGNGQIMRRWSGFSYDAKPRLVPVPKRPV